LVGLRWWSDFQEDGKEVWTFECKVNEKKNNPIDSNLFWGIQIICTLFWCVIIVINALSISPITV
jgi:hypothetical protein